MTEVTEQSPPDEMVGNQSVGDGNKSSPAIAPTSEPSAPSASSAVPPTTMFDDEVPPEPVNPKSVAVNPDSSQDMPSSTETSYGPLRRVRQENGPPALYRPPSMHADDFADLMREVVPQLMNLYTPSVSWRTLISQ